MVGHFVAAFARLLCPMFRRPHPTAIERAVDGGGVNARGKADDDEREPVAGKSRNDGGPTRILLVFVCIHKLMNTVVPLLNYLALN